MHVCLCIHVSSGASASQRWRERRGVVWFGHVPPPPVAAPLSINRVPCTSTSPTDPKNMAPPRPSVDTVTPECDPEGPIAPAELPTNTQSTMDSVTFRRHCLDTVTGGGVGGAKGRIHQLGCMGSSGCVCAVVAIILATGVCASSTPSTFHIPHYQHSTDPT